MNKDDKKKIAELINDIIKDKNKYTGFDEIDIADFLRVVDNIQDKLTIMITKEGDNNER